MSLVDLDHVNVRTDNLEALSRFYEDILGLEPGPRPPFSFGGRWLYCGAKAAIHLVERDALQPSGEPRIEHFAFKASGLADFLAHLRDRGVAYRISIVPGWGIRQVNIYDPDGNHIEVAFAAEEQADLENFAGAG